MTAAGFRPGTAADRVDGEVPPQVAEPESGEAFAEILAQAARERLSTVIRGGGTKLSWGRPPASVDLVVSTARLNRLVAHRHGDLTATVQAGMSLREFNAALALQRQWFPVESAFGDATIGGVVATNDAGPSRHRHGTPRDLVIGITLALTDGRLVKAGGTVVKNVAGYDLGKLVSGSHGTLAGIVDVTFKLVPVPQASSTIVASYTDAAALTHDAAALEASQIEAAAFDVWAGDAEPHYQLKLRIASSPAALEAQIATARKLITGEAAIASGRAEEAAWAQQLAGLWNGSDTLVRVSWLPSRLPQVFALLAEIQRLDRVRITFAGRLVGAGAARVAGDIHAVAAAVGRLRASDDIGNVVVLRASRELKHVVDVWGPGRPSDRIARALKLAFDPAGILNAGRGPI